MTATPLPALDAAKSEPGIERFRWLFACLAGVVLLILFGDILPAWVVTPPKTWTENLPLPYLIFGEGFLRNAYRYSKGRSSGQKLLSYRDVSMTMIFT